MSIVPGIKAKHAIITPACRSKGDRRAFTEAVEVLRKEYEDTLRLRAENDAGPANFHLILTVEPVG